MLNKIYTYHEESWDKMVEMIKDIFKKKNKVTYNINRKRKFDYIRSLFDKYKEENNYVDESTWNDLNMNKVFSKIDRTLTTPGEQILYKFLRTPLNDNKSLKERGKMISIFDNNKRLRTKIHEKFNKLGRIDNDVIYVLQDRLVPDLKTKILYNLLALISFINILLFFILPSYRELFILALFGISMINMLLHYRTGLKIGDKIEVIQYTGNMIKISGNLLKIAREETPDYYDELKRLYNKVKIIRRKSGIIAKVEGLDAIADYINILFLVKERNYYSTVDDVNKYRKEIVELYNLIGEIDAYISISLYRETLDYYTEPKIIKNKKILETDEIIHPLLEKPVSNSISFEKGGMILTGSNMSGKSTFLRTMGINSILAQTIYTVLAKKHKTSFYNVVSSISLKDDIEEGKSYYFAETEAIVNYSSLAYAEVGASSIMY